MEPNVRMRDHPCDISVVHGMRLDAFDTWMRCVYGRAHTREKKWKWKVSLTTGVTDRFALGISTPERRTGGLTISTGLRSRERSRLGLDGR